MGHMYRFKFRSERFEIELESDDQEFIAKEMIRLANWANENPSRDAQLLNVPDNNSYMSNRTSVADIAPDDIEEDIEEVEAVVEEEEEIVEVRHPKETKAKKRGPKPGSKSKGKRGRPPGSKNKATKTKKGENVEATEIAKLIKISDRYPIIEQRILNKANQVNRILLALSYAGATYSKSKGFTTSLIEGVTTELGAQLRRSNIAAQIKKNEQYFNWDQEPKRGVTVHYNLTRKGKNAFDELLNKA